MNPLLLLEGSRHLYVLYHTLPDYPYWPYSLVAAYEIPSSILRCLR